MQGRYGDNSKDYPIQDIGIYIYIYIKIYTNVRRFHELLRGVPLARNIIMFPISHLLRRGSFARCEDVGDATQAKNVKINNHRHRDHAVLFFKLSFAVKLPSSDSNSLKNEPFEKPGMLFECAIFLTISLTERNYWADNSYYSDLEVTIYGK